MRSAVWFVGLLGLLWAGAGAAVAQDAPDVTELLRDVRTAGPDDRAAAVRAVVQAKPSLAEVQVVLQSGLQPETLQAGWSRRQARDSEGVERPYHLYIPTAVAEAGDAVPLLVHMHGGVARPEFTSGAEFAARGSMWQPVADAHGFCIAFPLGRRDCVWYSDAGSRHIQAVIRDAKRRAPVDDAAVFGTGFSDGGSGCYYYAMTMPDPWAGLLPLNGHPGVGSMVSGKQLYPQNAALTYLFICHTADDSLYPGKEIMPYWQAFLDQGTSMRTILYPNGDHSPSYFGEQGPVMGNWIATTRRDDVSPLVEWHTAHPEVGAARWVRITKLGAAAGEAPAWPDVNVMTVAGRVRLGVIIDQDYRGGGAKIEEVRDGTTASAMGLKAGDIIQRFDGRPIRVLGDLRAALQRKQFGEPLSLLVEREGHERHVELTGAIAPFTPQPVFRREQPQASIRVQAIGNDVRVKTHHVRAFQLEVRPDLFDLAAPLEITVNGKPAKRVTVTPDLFQLVNGYAQRADGGRLTLAVIDVELPAAAAGEGDGRDF